MPTLTTPSGHVVELKEDLSFGDERAIRRKMSNAVRLVAKDKDGGGEMQGSTFLMDGEEECARRVITSITLADGTRPTGDVLAIINTWPRKDGRAVFAEVGRIFGEIVAAENEESPEKKEI